MKKLNYEAPMFEEILIATDLIRTSLINGGEGMGDEVLWDSL